VKVDPGPGTLGLLDNVLFSHIKHPGTLLVLQDSIFGTKRPSWKLSKGNLSTLISKLCIITIYGKDYCMQS
jgi:hypothetical protein